jgi:hypothetical protein
MISFSNGKENISVIGASGKKWRKQYQEKRYE